MANSKQMEGGAGGSPGGIDISIPDAPDPKGGIEIEGKAGTAETLLLYAIQVRETANRIGAAVAGFVKQGTVIVIAGDPEIDVGLADQFDTACTELDRLLDEALRPITPPAQDVAAESLVAGAAVSAIGTILKASATAAQYFAVKTKLAGIEITPNDSLLAIAVAGVLLEQKPPPKVYPAPFETSDARKSVHERIGALGTKAGRAQVAAQVANDTVGRLIVTAERVLVVDFKTGLRVPGSPDSVPLPYVRQMAAYRAVLGKAFPEVDIQWYQAGSEAVASRVNAELAGGIDQPGLRQQVRHQRTRA